MRASIWVFETLMRNESKGVQWRAEVGTLSFLLCLSRREGEGTIDRPIACETSSESTAVGTRKMVNYA